MKVYNLVKKCGYIRNVLDHIKFEIFNSETDDFIEIKPTADSYIALCNRKVLEWFPAEESNDFDGIYIYVKMKKNDYFTFKDYVK